MRLQIVALVTLVPLIANAGASAPASDDQISFAADSTDGHDAEGFVLLRGNVEIRRSDTTLVAPEVRMTFDRPLTRSHPQVDHVSASGRVRVARRNGSAVSDFAIWDVQRSLVTMVGHVTLVQPSGTISGARLVWDVDSGRATLDGDPRQGESGRVVGRYVPAQR